MQRCGNIAREIRLSCQWVSGGLGSFAVRLVVPAVRGARHVAVQQRTAGKQATCHFQVETLGVAAADVFHHLRCLVRRDANDP
ncbi:hypothetical protein G6F31_021215 [Rhizopus arrhizus]|nr:hypothetical protein G6F31_021215 [Rhizopus arrhizus]